MVKRIEDIIGNNGNAVWDSIPSTDDKIYIKTPDARNVLARGIRHFVGDKAVWLPEYDKVAEWLSDNKGRGLLCIGNCGRGKSVICANVLPVVFQHWHHKIMNTVTSTGLNSCYEEYVQYKIISVDDVGIEPVASVYGEKHSYFTELVDAAEKMDKLLVITSNMNIEELLERYGERTIDRLRALTTVVVFKGESLRK